MYSSRTAYDPNAFDSFWKPFIRVFQAFCLSHYSLFHSGNHNGRRFVYFMFYSIFLVLLNVYGLEQIYSLDKRLYAKSPLMYYVSYMSIVCHAVIHVVYHSEAIFFLKEQNEIYQKLREIDEVFATKLEYVTDFRAIRKQFERHTAAYFLFTASFFFGGIFYSHPAGSTVAFILGRCVVTPINFVRRFQIAIHINSVTNILIDLNILLKRQQQTYRPGSNALTQSNAYESMRHLRCVYSNAWSIVKLMNRCYGWTFVVFLIEFTIDFINSSYQFYLNILIYKSAHNIIRKYSQ